MDREINSCFSALDQQQVIERLKAGGIAYGALNDLRDLSAHPQLRRSTVATPTGPASIVSPPALAADEQDRLNAVPDLGEHSDAIRREFS